MRAPALLLLASFALALAAGGEACAQAPAPAPVSAPDVFVEKLKTYEPAAVVAASQYARNVNMRGNMERQIPMILQGLSHRLKSNNPDLKPEQAKAFADLFIKKLMEDQTGAMERAATLALLETFSKEEIVALNEFYASPIGASVLAKQAQMQGRLDENLRLLRSVLFPRAIEAAKAQARQNGLDLKL